MSRMRMVAQVLKRASESGLVTMRVPERGRALKRDWRLIIAYHNVIPDDVKEAGDATLHLRQSAFAAQLEVLSETHRVVPLRSLIAEPPAPASSGHPLAAPRRLSSDSK